MKNFYIVTITTLSYLKRKIPKKIIKNVFAIRYLNHRVIDYII